jgi:hypothetical protein
MSMFTTAATLRNGFALALISSLALSTTAHGQAAALSTAGSLSQPEAPAAPTAAAPLTANFTDFTSFIATPASLAQHPAVTLAAFSRDIAILGATADAAQQQQFLAQVAALFQDATVADSAKTTIAAGFGQAFKSLAATNAVYADTLQETVLASASAAVANAFATATAEVATADIATASDSAATAGTAGATIGGDGAASASSAGSNGSSGQNTQLASDTFTTTSSGSFSGSRSGGSTRSVSDTSSSGL